MRDADGPLPGLFDSPWPAEDGGPRRQLVPRAPGLGLRAGERLAATSRQGFMFNMVVLRAPGEVFVQGSTAPGPDSTAWVERVDPTSLAPLARSPDLPGGPWWPGSVTAHANGSLYVVHGRWCHRLDAGCAVLAARELPRARPYNGCLVLSDGCLVTKSFVRDGSAPSALVVLEPERLTPTGPEVVLPEGAIARLSTDTGPDGELVYVVGDHTVLRYRYGAGRLERDPEWSLRYRVLPDGEQSYGWDPVIAGGDVWFMDNGENVFGTSFRGGGVARGPLHLWRVSVADPADHDMLTPFDLPHGTIVNPPLVDSDRGLVVAYDSGNGRLAAFRFDGPGRFARRWEHAFGASSHFLLYRDTGEIVVNDFRDDAGEHVVVLDVATGAERGRVATGSPVQSVVFPAPGFDRDLYACSFATLAHVRVAG
jgi:hypothetical protein